MAEILTMEGMLKLFVQQYDHTFLRQTTHEMSLTCLLSGKNIAGRNKDQYSSLAAE